MTRLFLVIHAALAKAVGVGRARGLAHTLSVQSIPHGGLRVGLNP